jgi:hypothetical protein
VCGRNDSVRERDHRPRSPRMQRSILSAGARESQNSVLEERKGGAREQGRNWFVIDAPLRPSAGEVLGLRTPASRARHRARTMALQKPGCIVTTERGASPRVVRWCRRSCPVVHFPRRSHRAAPRAGQCSRHGRASCSGHHSGRVLPARMSVELFMRGEMRLHRRAARCGASSM